MNFHYRQLEDLQEFYKEYKEWTKPIEINDEYKGTINFTYPCVTAFMEIERGAIPDLVIDLDNNLFYSDKLAKCEYRIDLENWFENNQYSLDKFSYKYHCLLNSKLPFKTFKRMISMFLTKNRYNSLVNHSKDNELTFVLSEYNEINKRIIISDITGLVEFELLFKGTKDELSTFENIVNSLIKHLNDEIGENTITQG